MRTSLWMLSLWMLTSLFAAVTPNFTGDWKLVVEKSDFGGRSSPSSATLKIDHRDPSLKVTRVLKTNDREIIADNVYSTDGKETANALPGGRVIKSQARWSGSTLVIETPVTLNCNRFSIVWKWSLSPDVGTLTTVRDFGDGSGTQTEVYERK